MAEKYNESWDFINISRDQIVHDAATGAILGIRTDADMVMYNGVTDLASSIGGALKTISGRNIIIPDASQSVIYGGVTISSGSITCVGTGEFVTVAY